MVSLNIIQCSDFCVMWLFSVINSVIVVFEFGVGFHHLDVIESCQFHLSAILCNLRFNVVQCCHIVCLSVVFTCIQCVSKVLFRRRRRKGRHKGIYVYTK